MGATNCNYITLYSPLSPPEHRHENQDDSKYLQTADEHAETEIPLGQVWNGRPGKSRSGTTQGRSRIAESRYRHTYRSIERESHTLQDEDAQHHQDKVDAQHCQNLVNHVTMKVMSIESDGGERARVECLQELVLGILEEHYDADNLQAARRRTGTSAHRHQQQGWQPIDGSPLDIVEILPLETC